MLVATFQTLPTDELRAAAYNAALDAGGSVTSGLHLLLIHHLVALARDGEVAQLEADYDLVCKSMVDGNRRLADDGGLASALVEARASLPEAFTDMVFDLDLAKS